LNSIQISDLRAEPSPRLADMIRLSVEVRYPGRFSSSERAWFEIPEIFASEATPRGDPWLLSYLPLAVALGHPIETDLPVDQQLIDNVRSLMEIWARWYPGMAPVELQVGVAAPSGRQPPERTGLFFSAGVDSFYSLLRTEEIGDPHIDDLLVLHGFDFEVDNDRAMAAVMDTANAVAREFGKVVVPIGTNIRETRFGEASWSELAAGCLLGGAGLILGGRYRHLLISSTLAPGHFRPHASHPETDPLFSTAQTSFVHFGEDLSRIPKLQYLQPHPIAMRNLRVCYESDDGSNCSRCLKCVVVMSMLELIGSLEQATTFGDKELDLDLIRGTYLSQGAVSFRQIKEFALSIGRLDVAEAVDSAFARTQWIDRWLLFRWLRTARERWQYDPLLRRWTAWLRPWLWRLGRRLNRLAP
jgi:hypothetical protein